MEEGPSGYRSAVIDQEERPRPGSTGWLKPAAAGSTTDSIEPDPGAGARGVWLRRIFMALLAVLVALGLLGLLGVRSRTVTAQSADGQVELSVRYAQVARAGLDVPFRITVRRQGGFAGDVTLAASSSYLDLFDRNAVDPEPSSATSTEDDVIWQFHQPPGDTLEVSLDMQVQGGRHWGRSGHVSVLDQSGQPVATVSFKTWLVP
jgi:hypothetical protein